jgi:hypothetical protein
MTTRPSPFIGAAASLRVLAVAGVVAAVSPALAQGGLAPQQTEGPQLFGMADFEMEWRLSPQEKVLRVQFLAAKRRLRIEALDGSDQVMLRDLVTGKVVILVTNGARGAFGTMAKPLAAFRPDSVGELREVAGNQCRDFMQEGRKLCVTDDGIPVEVDFGGGVLSATRLMRRAQVPALFEVPADLTLKPVPGDNAGALPQVPF